MYRSQSAYELPWGINGHASGESVTSGAVNGAWAYQYDSHQRVEHAVFTPAGGPPLAFDYAYDGYDNLIAANGRAMGYASDTNKLQSVLDDTGAWSVEYDGAGRIVRLESALAMQTYAYNSDNLTAAYTDAAGATTYYRYGYTNLLTARETSDGGLQIYGYRRANPGLSSWVLTADGFSDNLMMGAYTPVAAFAPGGEYYYLTDDDSSRVLAIADATGRAYVPHDDPYGQEIANPNAPQKLGVAEFQPLFAGQLQFPGEPHVYNHHRFYRPDLGRYLSPDPIKTPGGNMYAYAEGNPVGLVDPMALEAETGEQICGRTFGGSVCGSLAQGCGFAFADQATADRVMNELGRNGLETTSECFLHICDGTQCQPCSYSCLGNESDRGKELAKLENSKNSSSSARLFYDLISRRGCDSTTGGSYKATLDSDTGTLLRAIIIFRYKAAWGRFSYKNHKCAGIPVPAPMEDRVRMDLISGRAIMHEVAHCCGWVPDCKKSDPGQGIHGHPWSPDPCAAQ